MSILFSKKLYKSVQKHCFCRGRTQRLKDTTLLCGLPHGVKMANSCSTFFFIYAGSSLSTLFGTQNSPNLFTTNTKLLLQQVAVNVSFHTLGLIYFNKTEIYQWQNLPGAGKLSLNNRIKHLFIYVKYINIYQRADEEPQ